MPEKKDKLDVAEKQPMPAKLPITKPAPKKIAPLAPPPSGLDWERIRTEFEKDYDPAKGPQGAGRLIARIVVNAIIEIAKEK